MGMSCQNKEPALPPCPHTDLFPAPPLARYRTTAKLAP